ncbi:MAG: CapA family protein [Candidatus Eremiobacteraeota bacterium]|nr:CapA family protein [Candidatus Eremiobacteraeota bacterium]
MPARASRGRFVFCVALLAAVIAVMLAHAGDADVQPNPADPGVKNASKLDPRRPLSAELQTSVGDGFTLTCVGDLIISRPLSQYAAREPGFRSVLETLRQGDALCGNMETSILDLRGFNGYPYSYAGDWTLSALPAVAGDLKKMGFDLVSRANNHAEDWGIEGMRETSRLLDGAGIVWAGVGEDRGQARAPAFFESPKGRIGLVSFASTYLPTAAALPPEGAAPGRPGVSTLAVTQYIDVPKEVMQTLAAASCRLQAQNCKTLPQKLTIFNQNFKLSSGYGYEYVMDDEDQAEIYKAIREGKQNADFLIATIHSHDCGQDCDNIAKPELAAAYLRTLAHRAVDAGADEFIVTGIHNLGPLEIYRGRPIFYGMSNFFWSDIQLPLPHDLYQYNRAVIDDAYLRPDRVTNWDLSAPLNAQGGFAEDYIFQAIITQAVFEHERLAKLKLYAIDLGYGKKLTESGIPQLATPEQAKAIFERIKDATAQYGLPPLKMTVEGSVATIVP